MDCPDCERIDDIIFPETTIWFWPPTEDSHHKMLGLLNSDEYTAVGFGERGLRLTLPSSQIKALGLILMGALENEELRGLKIATTPRAELGPDDLGRFSTGAAFVARIESEWLIDALRAERFESWLQPIVTTDGAPFAHEALFRIREKDGSIIGPQRAFDVASEGQLLFNLDLVSRRSAVQTAAKARLPGKLFINFNPSSIYDPAYCLRTTASVVQDIGLKPQDIVFEVTESDQARDLRHLKGILAFY
ncbi:MAG: EAL domain-containing protein, partial [Pseudomonadota bacterium]